MDERLFDSVPAVILPVNVIKHLASEIADALENAKDENPRDVIERLFKKKLYRLTPDHQVIPFARNVAVYSPLHTTGLEGLVMYGESQIDQKS